MSPDELNQQCFDQLQRAGVGQGRYVAVVGAGPSSPLIPAGKELVRQLAAACGLNPEDPRSYWEFFEDAKRKDEASFCRIIDERFRDQPYIRLEAYRQIVAVPFKSFITLNYDNCLPAAFADKTGEKWEEMFSIYPMRRRPNGEMSGFASAVDLGHKRRLVAVHGYRDPNDPRWPATKIVLTTSDYEKHYCSHETGTYLANWWKEVLTIHDCLFIGTSLKEPGLELVVSHLLRDENPDFRRRRHLHLKDVSLRRTILSETEYSDDYPPPEVVFGVIPQIQFDPKDQFAGLIDVLSRLSGIISRTDFEPGMPALGQIGPA